jgi:hypothetical protein
VQRILAGALLVLLCGGAAMAAEPAPIRLELNRLEPVEKGCRVYLVVGNEGTEALQSLKLDLVLFRSDGVIDRRLALETGPLRAAKTSVKLFDLTDLPCDGLGSILVNDVLSCGASGEAGSDCFPRLALATRTPAGFNK